MIPRAAVGLAVCVTGCSEAVTNSAPDASTDSAVAVDARDVVTIDASLDVAPDAGSIDVIDASDVTAADSGCPAGTCRNFAGAACEMPTGPVGNGCCQCGPNGICAALCRCASPDTPIATPYGERPIAELAVGDLVYTLHRGSLVAAPVARVNRTVVTHHRVVRVVLSSGRELRISAGHPTADGRSFGELRAGDPLGDVRVASVELVPYAHPATYDILPASDSGTYLAAGALVGSTLSPVTASLPVAACNETLSP